MHYFEKLGSKSFGVDFKGHFLSIVLLLFIFGIYIFVKAENPRQQELTEEQKLDYGISLSRTLNIANNLVFMQEGSGSWYGRRFHNRRTANGERFNMNHYTAAHKKLPFGTIIRVTNKNNGFKTFVRINDRGPYVGKRILDLSFQSAKKISGVGLPQIKIEGFLTNSINLETIDRNYYFSYSYDYPLVCLPKDALMFKDSVKTFEDAVDLYEEYSKVYTNEIIYLSIPVNKKDNKNNSGYYITFLNINYSLSERNSLASVR